MTSDTAVLHAPPAAVVPYRTIWPITCLVFLASLAWFLIGTKDAALIDRDEPMIAEVARQMVHRDQWLTPHLPAWEEKSIFKPPMTMWAIAACFRLLGVSELPARLPSIFCSALTVTILFAAASRRWGCSAGLVAAACMTLPLIVAVIGRMAITDPLLTLLATIILLCLDRLLRSPEAVTDGSMAGDGPAKVSRMSGSAADTICRVVLWTALGLSFLVKGPALLAFVAPVLVLAGDRGRWRPYLLFVGGALMVVLPGYVPLVGLPAIATRAVGTVVLLVCMARWVVPVFRLPIGLAWGLPLALLVSGWWFAYIALTSTAYHQTLQRYAGFEVLTRLVEPIEGHWGPPGYYIIVAMIGLMPFSALLPGLLKWAFRVGRMDGTILLLLAWIIGPWLLWEVVVTKLPHYVLPMMPAIALLAATAWHRAADWRAAFTRSRARAICLPLPLMATGLAVFALVASSGPVRAWLLDRFRSGDESISMYIAHLARIEPWQTACLLLAAVLLAATATVVWLRAACSTLRQSLAILAIGWTGGLLPLLVALMAATPFTESLSRQVARQALAFDQPGLQYHVVGYTEPGVFFYLPPDRYHRLARPRAIASLARMDEPFVLITSRKLEPDVRRHLASRIADMHLATGLNAAKARPETACVFRIDRNQKETPAAVAPSAGVQ